MPDYPVERTLRTVPAALFSLMRKAGIGGGTTPEDADRWAAQRNDEFPTQTDPLFLAGNRPLAAAGLYPLPGETKGQLQDAVLGPTEQWFPTPGLARRARGITPQDVNLPNESPVADTDPRWAAFVRERNRPHAPVVAQQARR